jgi:hypothetical protein
LCPLLLRQGRILLSLFFYIRFLFLFHFTFLQLTFSPPSFSSSISSFSLILYFFSPPFFQIFFFYVSSVSSLIKYNNDGHLLCHLYDCIERKT